jgi:biotin-dependent carboxylase-like uncharacterized protein
LSDVPLIVLDAGLYTTVQDLGRAGYRAWGIPPGGAFDDVSHRLANALLGNRAEDATLEITLLGGTYRAGARLALALAGAPIEARVETASGWVRRVTAPQSFGLGPGDRLVLGGMPRGARSYLAVAGGWQTPLLLGSRSSETPLQARDTLPAREHRTPVRRPVGIESPAIPDRAIRLLRVPGTNRLGVADAWSGCAFRVASEAGRMGIRLEGPPLVCSSGPVRLSTPVSFGAVQIAGGRLVVLGPACGTMGGYPHVAQVISADLPRLGQLRPGNTVRFEWVSLSAARRVDRETRAYWANRLLTISTLGSDRWYDRPLLPAD